MEGINFEIENEEQLKAILDLRDELILVYDELRFASSNINYKTFEKVKNRLTSLEEMIKKYVKEHENCLEIICLKDAIIEPQENIEVRTNITGLRLEEGEMDVNFKGFIPSDGYLELSSNLKKWGMEVRIKNNVPNMSKDGGPFCNPYSTRYFWHGIYLIEKDTTLGIGIREERQLIKSL